MRFALAAFVFFAIAANILAADRFYIRPDAKGSNDGSDWKNAHPRFPATLRRGATYYLSDGDYASHTFDTAKEGARTIVIKKANAADHGTDAGWDAALGDGVANFTGIAFESDDWILDGGGRTAPGKGHGIKIANSADRASLITVAGKSSHITLRYLELVGDPALKNRGTGIYAVGGPSHLLVQHCHLRDFFGVPFHLIDASQVTIEHSLIARNKSTSEWHSEGIQARGCRGLVVRHNTWEDMQGTAVIVSGSGNSSDWTIHGNTFLRGNVGHGIVADNMVDSIEDVTVSENVIIGHRGNAGMNFHKAKGHITVVNNVWYDNSWISFLGTTTRDFNYFSRCRFPLGFRSAAHETPTREAKTGQVSIPEAPPFVDITNGDFTLSGEALQARTRDKR